MIIPMQLLESRDRLRNALSFAVVCGFTLMLAGTSKNKTTDTKQQPTPINGNPASPTPAAATMPDVDINAVMAVVNCPKSGHPACRLFADFAIGTPYTDAPTGAGNALWYGETIGAGNKANFAKEYFFVQVESTPEGVNASPRSLFPGTQLQKKESADLLAAMRAGRTPPANSMKSFISTVGGGMKRMARTSGTSMGFPTEAPRMTYMRRLGSRLLVLEYSPLGIHHVGGTAGDATAWIGETWILN